jgi:integrase
MNLIELPKSPYWGINVHVGFHPDGKRRYSPRSTKVLRDPSRVDDNGRRLDKIEATKIATALQQIANEAMEESGEEISRERAQDWVESLLRVMGKKIRSSAPSWNSFATETLTRHCRDLAPKSVRSYWSKKSTFDKWLENHPKLSVDSSLADFKLSDIQQYYDDWMAAGGQSTTANGNLTGIQLVFEEAVIHDHIPKNPCKGVKRRDNVMTPRQPFTLADLASISSALVTFSEAIEHAAEWILAIRFAMFTGAREGDCVSLSWSDFSDDCGEVRFVPQKKERLHRLGKIDASVSLLLPEFIAKEMLVARKAASSEFVTPSLRTIDSGRRGLGPRFREIMDFAGIKYSIRQAKGKGGKAQCSHSFHSFRHSLKTLLEAGGVSREVNHRVTGHEDPKVGARYIHVQAEAVFKECQSVFSEIEVAITPRPPL